MKKVLKFVCPRCHAHLSLSEERAPAAGAWARCPKCHERFFLKVRAADLPGAGEAPPRRLRPAGRTAAEQELLLRQRAKMGRPQAETSLEGPMGAWGEVVVFPTPAPNYRLYGLAAALAVAGLLGFLMHAFQSSGAGPHQPLYQAPRAMSYEESGLIMDLAAMRRDFSRRPGLSRNIDYSGREVRVFKYLLSELAPGACVEELASVRLWSRDTGAGFKAVGACLAEGQTTPELEINWQGGTVLASLSEGRPFLEIPLSPAPAGAGEAQ